MLSTNLVLKWGLCVLNVLSFWGGCGFGGQDNAFPDVETQNVGFPSPEYSHPNLPGSVTSRH